MLAQRLDSPGDERRLGPRHDRRLRMALGNVLVFTRDLSPGGFCAEMMHVLAPGTSVAGTLALGGRDFPFTGRVSWSQSGDPKRARRGVVGVCFTGIENGFFQTFQRVVVDGDSRPRIRVVPRGDGAAAR